MRMFALYVAALSALLMSQWAAAAPSAWDRTSSCLQNRARIVGVCFEFYGRARQGNGTPSARIWRLGTHRIYGVDDEGFPDNVNSLMQDRSAHQDVFSNDVYAVFLVCPYAKAVKGHMQSVCVAKARNIRHVIRH